MVYSQLDLSLKILREKPKEYSIIIDINTLFRNVKNYDINDFLTYTTTKRKYIGFLTFVYVTCNVLKETILRIK